jgi:hypothetical protein
VSELPALVERVVTIDGAPSWSSHDTDGDRLLIAPAEIPGVGAGVYFRTDYAGSSVPFREIPALIERLQQIADYAATQVEVPM